MFIRRTNLRVASLCVGLFFTTTSIGFAQSKVEGQVRVAPARIELKHPRQPNMLIVGGESVEGYTVDLGAQAKFKSASEKIAAVDANGWVRPIANGETEITVTAAGQTVKVPVKVALPNAEPEYSFRHEVMPVFSMSGCNLGACHGYSLGKAGFKLSLRGEDHVPDLFAVTRDAVGRRVDFGKPEASLLIAKPLGTVPHQGGVRFDRESLSYEILKNWVAQGAPSDSADKNEVVRVRVTPEKLVLAPGMSHRVRLEAEYSDGSTRDVTRLGLFNANNELHATVNGDGLVTAGDYGETAMVCRFERKFAAVDVIVLKHTPSFKPAPVPNDHLIDKFVVQKLNDLKIELSPPANDAEFLRRVHLDLIGLQPSAEDVRTFLADIEPNKRAKLIDRLIARPEFIDWWSLKWGDLLQNSRNVLGPNGVFLFREWIRGAVAENMPLDEFARRLLTARGGVQDDPAAAYLSISKDTNDTVERTTQVFCGVRMLCARCHSHPMENWTQGDYFGVASFFNQTTTKADPRASQTDRLNKVLFVNLATGPTNHPRTNRPQPPRFLGGDEPQIAMNADRREHYAKWLTAAENPFFARGLVNRIWSYFFHRGIVEPVDDVRSTNPPINPQLLEALTKDFVNHKFDMRHLMRTIVTSRVYQASSLPTETNKSDQQNFSHSIPRRVPAEALLDSLVQATGVKENFPGNFTAVQLPDASASNDFLNLFGKPQRMEACECERDSGSNMLQALHLINGNSIQAKVTNGNGRLATLLRQKLDDDKLVEEIYLWSIARQPTDKERKVATDYLQAGGEKKNEAAQDLMWALLNSRDFMLVH